MQLGATEISRILRGGCDPAGSQTPTRFGEEGGGRDLPPCQGTSRESLKPQRNVSARSALDELQRRQGPGCLRSPQQDQAVQGQRGWPFWRDKKGLGAMPRSSPSRSTITFIASGTHASAVVSGGKSLTNICVPASAAQGSRTSEHDATVSGKLLETYVGVLLISNLVASSQASLSRLCSLHDELCTVIVEGWEASVTWVMCLCRCVRGDSTVQTESLFLLQITHCIMPALNISLCLSARSHWTESHCLSYDD